MVGELDSARVCPKLVPQVAAPLVTVLQGAPRLHLSNLHLFGSLSVQGGELEVTDCIIEGDADGGLGDEFEANTVASLGASAAVRALSITGGFVTLVRTVLFRHTHGAIGVDRAVLTLIDCTVTNSRESSGGALLVTGGSNVSIERSSFTENRAIVHGGALQVAGVPSCSYEALVVPNPCCLCPRRRSSVASFTSSTRLA